MARLCGYLPLALRLAASTLAEQENLRVERYLARLKNAQARLDLVDASLNLSYDLLGSELQRRWRTLGVFPATFNLAAAAAVWDIVQDTAEEALGELLRYSMVEWDKTADRYGLHDLVRTYADARLGDEERFQGKRRLAKHYERVLHAADELYRQGQDHVQSVLTLFDLEQENVEAGQRWAAEHYERDLKAAQLCASYPVVGWHYLDFRLSREAQIGWLEPAVEAARRIKDHWSEFSNLSGLGLVYRNLGQTAKAVEFYQRALDISRENGDRGREAHTLSNLGAALRQLEQPERGLKLIKQSLTIARSMKDLGLETVALGHLGGVYRASGRMERALACYQRSLKIDRETGNRQHERWSLVYLGGAYHDLGQINLAIDSFQQTLAIDHERGNRRQERWSLVYLAREYLALEQAEQAVALYKQVLAVDQELSDRKMEGVTLDRLGVAYLVLGRTGEAIEHLEQALAIAREISDKAGESRVCYNIACVYARQEDADKVYEWLDRAIDMDDGYRQMARDDTDFDAIRTSKQFQSLVKEGPQESQ
jgi:tetratricopeptide (TPR) repeat protein